MECEPVPGSGGVHLLPPARQVHGPEEAVVRVHRHLLAARREGVAGGHEAAELELLVSEVPLEAGGGDGGRAAEGQQAAVQGGGLGHGQEVLAWRVAGGARCEVQGAVPGGRSQEIEWDEQR